MPMPFMNNNNMNMASMMSMMNNMNMGNNMNQMAMNNNNNASQLYVIQLRELRNMGFHDEQRNINALVASGGNVAIAVQHLVNDNTSNTSSDNGSKDQSKK